MRRIQSLAQFADHDGVRRVRELRELFEMLLRFERRDVLGVRAHQNGAFLRLLYLYGFRDTILSALNFVRLCAQRPLISATVPDLLKGTSARRLSPLST